MPDAVATTANEIELHGVSDLSLSERLALIGLIEEGAKAGSPQCPAVADLFENLWDLVKRTVSGAKIDRLSSMDPANGFKSIEVTSESGEHLGRLTMLYMNKPMPCYYLIYVEVAPPFRKRGLGKRIIEHFRSFLEEKGALGILDNIIPPDDPTYDIYLKQAWEPIEAILGEKHSFSDNGYMIYVPVRMRQRDLADPLIKLLHHLKRRRAAIEMRDNEIMVRRTIKEFRELYNALLIYFRDQLERGETSPLMRFMFTRFVTKLISFRRRIGELLGYTGGESMEQIELSPMVAALPMKSYAPKEIPHGEVLVSGDLDMWTRLPPSLREAPARVIERLPNYRRPSLLSWLKARGRDMEYRLTIGDLLDLGFDPTRLKEITVDGEDFIFERMQARQAQEVEQRRTTLLSLGKEITSMSSGNTKIRINPPLLMVRDRGNAYVMRRKIPAIHWEEALEQIKTSPSLKAVNAAMGLDRLLASVVNRSRELVAGFLGREEGFAYFVSWDISKNMPLLVVDFHSSYLESVWMA
jgi:GNAT superfamily N-acetyltransferase